ncbi:hypothetical protein M441DRAFT_43980 [Trichoderma asperellum CBS 433.97]|uniref:C2H2-type domain-containing protein n=1 Tax=Trichoderma asperellum (strain ATCC 204424 / CBS 433.97 / NBRC 101777) TaxID=1042311 RepID=A0A2T3ZGB7_TRIA4|nr:hypothetical protein M441DRAFT_43980 [Trichoderma asperellum CBS 433.97]PTB43847.1 hypothetical protein M441DRAFT_43980 [Trichoderma asperellum CBS 433.97]
MATLSALASGGNLLSDVSEEIKGDLEWLLNLPQEPFTNSKDVLALYEGIDSSEGDCSEDDGRKKMKAYREKVWTKWLTFCEAAGKDSEKVWIDLSLDKDDAKQTCKAFLHSYVANSVVRRPCLGPEEWEEVQTVTCAVTVEDIWCALVYNANKKILRPKAKKEGESPGSWVLHFSSKYGNCEGPAYDIARYIPILAKKVNLSLEQLVEKRQMTVEDVLLFLDTLWTKAEHIPCKPNVRNALHCVILLGAFGGWRPGSLMNIKYRDVEFGWYSHPRLRFTISTMACRQICLLSHLAATAIADNAFEANFTSPAQILSGQPLEPGISYVPLKWRSDILDEYIVPITYSTYNNKWHRTLLVSGLRDAQRVVPYAMRVGAGIRLNGPLRNFVLNHTNKIYEANYLPKHLSDDLAHASFGELAGNNNDLSSSMSRVLIARDANAPLYITQDDRANFEKRRDISTLRQLYAKAKVHEPKMVSTIYHRIEYILFRLDALQLASSRKEYFMCVDRMRAEGKQIQHAGYSPTKYARPSRGNSAWQTARRIGMLLRQDDTKPDVAIQKLIGYLTNKCVKDIFPEAEDSNRTKRDYQCFLCRGRYVKKFNLNRHFRDDHLNKLENGFPCPECLRDGIINPVNAGPEAWCSHVARFHGKDNAPNLKVQCKVEDSTYTNEESTGKRKRVASTKSSDGPCKKPRYNPNRKQGALRHEKKRNTFNLCKEEGKTLKYHDDEEGRKTPDPHEGEEFYVTGRDYLDEEVIDHDIGLDIKGIVEMKFQDK